MYRDLVQANYTFVYSKRMLLLVRCSPGTFNETEKFLVTCFYIGEMQMQADQDLKL